MLISQAVLILCRTYLARDVCLLNDPDLDIVQQGTKGVVKSVLHITTACKKGGIADWVKAPWLFCERVRPALTGPNKTGPNMTSLTTPHLTVAPLKKSVFCMLPNTRPRSPTTVGILGVFP